MDTETTRGDILRFIGLATVCVGIAWAVQVLGFGDAVGMGRFLWMVAAASVCGAGAGLVLASNALCERETASFG